VGAVFEECGGVGGVGRAKACGELDAGVAAGG